MNAILNWSVAPSLLATVLLGLATATTPEKPDLEVTGVEVFPYPLDYKAPKNVAGRMLLHQSGSCRVIVTIDKTGGPIGSFDVVAKATLTGVGDDIGVKNGPTVELGRARVGDAGGGRIFACFTIFPGAARAGDHDIRFVVDARGEVDEANETNNAFLRRGRFVAPKK